MKKASMVILFVVLCLSSVLYCMIPIAFWTLLGPWTLLALVPAAILSLLVGDMVSEYIRP